MPGVTKVELPGLDCGLCGYKHCEEFERELVLRPELLKRCIHISEDSLSVRSQGATPAPSAPPDVAVSATRTPSSRPTPFVDTLGRDFDFYLEHFPEDPGPREIILPHNPMITRELPVKKGDILIGRPLGISCGCPITHCGVAMEVDQRTGVIVWCVTGPLAPRAQGYKDLGYYIAEGYEGLIREAKSEIKIGCRYYFQPRMCMLQWRHSGLVNFMNRTAEGVQVRLEGLWIG
jgi:uncharacterized Fe-S cluster-containing protein